MKMSDNKLKEENEELKKKILELEERLKIYTNNESHKKYYEKHNETIKEKARNYMSKLKEWRHNAYLRRKEKIKQEQINNIID